MRACVARWRRFASAKAESASAESARRATSPVADLDLVKKIMPFLRGVTLAAGAKGEAREIELRQLIGGSPNRALLSWPLKLPDGTDVVLNELVEDILTYAQHDADAFGTPQTYVLVAYFALEKVAGATSPAFRLRSSTPALNPEWGTDDLAESEPATKGGMLAQTMRHNEALHRQTVAMAAQMSQQAQGVIGSLQIELRRRSDQESMWADKFIEAVKLFEDLASHGHERAIELKKSDTQAEFQKDAWGELKVVWPVIVNRILRTKGLPAPFRERYDPEIEMIDRVLGQLHPKEIQHIMAGLGPEKMIAFGELYEAFRARAKARAAAAAAKEEESNGKTEPAPGPEGQAD